MNPTDKRASREQITAECIDRALHTLRQFLGLDVAFISEFDNENRVIRHLDVEGDQSLLSVGQAIPLDEGYCLDVVEGRLPELIPDTSLVSRAAAKQETESFPIGAHVSVPIPLKEGGIYGTLCCLGMKPVPGLGERDLQVMRAVAELIGFHLDILLAAHRKNDVRRLVIETAMAAGLPDIAYQPVFRLATGQIVGAEALSRFPIEPVRSPDKWFAEAANVGLESALSELAIRHALTRFTAGFEAGVVLGLNISPSLVCQVDLVHLFEGFPCGQILLEITEHEIVEDYEALAEALVPIRALGVRVAIDDMGSGYANIRHVLKMKPDTIKIDASLINDIDKDPMKEAWLAGIMEFARLSSCEVLAEGVETKEELAVLHRLGVHLGQGFLLGRPMPVDEVIEAAIASRPEAQASPVG
ncbi:EAL domain-containing protein [Pararhizobium sp. BT-229]|uniref:sensor domain-containing phosphodiesterase n=1 Tax=Pararhizobium sp. BT-229 TaxID=2986923 RepID=UPI0021F7AC35|nr:EAL domain-containing protein [Pararhizobium sp. BT-229]MCV9964913.1 EAL domain-containing protein [Pararhizobium sp. BT-229]